MSRREAQVLMKTIFRPPGTWYGLRGGLGVEYDETFNQLVNWLLACLDRIRGWTHNDLW